jgi:hypothetical protein
MASRIDEMIARHSSGGNDRVLTAVRMQKLVGHKIEGREGVVALVRINALGIRGLRFSVVSVNAKAGTVDLLSEDGKKPEKGLLLSEVSIAPRKSRGEDETWLPAGF